MPRVSAIRRRPRVMPDRVGYAVGALAAGIIVWAVWTFTMFTE